MLSVTHTHPHTCEPGVPLWRTFPIRVKGSGVLCPVVPAASVLAQQPALSVCASALVPAYTCASLSTVPVRAALLGSLWGAGKGRGLPGLKAEATGGEEPALSWILTAQGPNTKG